MEMQEHVNIDYHFLNRAEIKIPNEKELNQIVYGDFFPSFNAFGFQNSLIVGTKGVSVC